MDSNSTTLSFRQIFLIYPHEGRTALRQASGNRRNLLNTDRLVLPASVLEALLHGRSSLAPSAHSNTYAAAPWPGVSAPISNSAGPLASNRELPHPLTFTVRNPRSHNIAYAGVEEFSAEPLGDLVTNSASASEHYSPLLAPLRLMEALASAPGEAVELELIVLPKATGAQLRPLDAGYRSIGDLRAALEAHLRSNFTTLATHDIITVPHGRHNYRFEVEQVQPGPAATVIDTDIAVDIIPFQEPIGIDPSSTEPSEPQGSTLESQGLSPTSSSLPNQDNASAMDGVEATDNQGTIKLDRPVRGTLSQQRRSHAWRFQADSDIPHIHLWLEASDGSVDIFVQPGTEPASYRDHLVASFSSQTTKQLDIAVDNTRNPSREFQINIIRFIDELDSTDMAGPVSYQLRITREPFGEVESDHLLTPAPVDESADQKTCPNCQTTVPSRSYELHATFCARNNTRCPACHRVLKRGEQADNHWHCDQCDTSGDTPFQRAKHLFFHHELQTCPCGYEGTSIPELAHHRCTVCPLRMIICRYCHTLTPQGPPSEDLRDKLSGLHEHESYCGNRTIPCTQCQKNVKLKEVATHMRWHHIQRQNQPLPLQLCANPNCLRPRALGASANLLDLCALCFGPFWSSAHDPDHRKLIQRVAEALHRQLTHGCGNSWCQNPMCATGTNSGPMDPTTAAVRIRPNVEQVVQLLHRGGPALAPARNRPGEGGKQSLCARDGPLQLCVDETTTRQVLLVNALAAEVQPRSSDQSLTGYPIEWLAKAVISAGSDLVSAKRWLLMHAPKPVLTNEALGASS